jgi:hypothetical protein
VTNKDEEPRMLSDGVPVSEDRDAVADLVACFPRKLVSTSVMLYVVVCNSDTGTVIGCTSEPPEVYVFKYAATVVVSTTG